MITTPKPREQPTSMGNIVYEVDIEVDNSVADEYRQWLGTHIDEILALPGFTGARVHEVLEPAPSAGRIGLCVQYLLRDETALQDYLREHAPRLRAEGVTRFGDRMHTQRRVLRLDAGSSI